MSGEKIKAENIISCRGCDYELDYDFEHRDSSGKYYHDCYMNTIIPKSELVNKNEWSIKNDQKTKGENESKLKDNDLKKRSPEESDLFYLPNSYEGHGWTDRHGVRHDCSSDEDRDDDLETDYPEWWENYL